MLLPAAGLSSMAQITELQIPAVSMRHAEHASLLQRLLRSHMLRLLITSNYCSPFRNLGALQERERTAQGPACCQQSRARPPPLHRGYYGTHVAGV